MDDKTGFHAKKAGRKYSNQLNARKLFGGGATSSGLWGLGISDASLAKASVKAQSDTIMRRMRTGLPDAPIRDTITPAPTRGKIKPDPEGKRKAKGGWTPDNLTPPDRKLYNEYHKTYPKATGTWLDGSPRNPMPEIRNQLEYDGNSKRDKKPR
jgi:hypothetical protein